MKKLNLSKDKVSRCFSKIKVFFKKHYINYFKLYIIKPTNLTNQIRIPVLVGQIFTI